MDLFTPIVDESKFHPFFANVLQQKNLANQQVVQDWANGFIDRDNKFVQEFQTTFNSSFWELYLYGVLKKLGCKVNFQHPSPDFVLTSPSICIEATIASNALGSPSASSPKDVSLPENPNELNRQAIIRLANSFSSKYKKYQKTYSKLQHMKEKPFVIAIAPFDRPHFQLQVQRSIEALLFDYYVDEEEYLAKGDLGVDLNGKNINKVIKNSGVSISLGVFNNESYSEVSAVIFSTAGSWGKVRALASDNNAHTYFDTIHYNPESVMPIVNRGIHKSNYTESILDGLRVYHNPFAKYPLYRSLFRFDEVFQSYYDFDKNDWIYELSSKNLLYRSVNTFIKMESKK